MKKYIWIFAVVVAGLVFVLSRSQDVEPVVVEEPRVAVGEGEDVAALPEAVVEDLPVLVKDVEESGGASDAVMALVDLETGYQDRLKAMRKLGYEIPEEDLDVLMEFLASEVNESNLRPLAYNSIRNDAVDLLLRQRVMPDGIGDLLVGLRRIRIRM